MSAEVAGHPKPARKPAARAAPRRAPVAAAPTSASDAISSASDLARAGQHAQVIEVDSKALDRPAVPDDDALALLNSARRVLPRSVKWIARRQTPRRCAPRRAQWPLGLLARALIALARVQVLSSDLDAADETAELALKTARKSRRNCSLRSPCRSARQGGFASKWAMPPCRMRSPPRAFSRRSATRCIGAARCGPSLAPMTSWGKRRRASALRTRLSRSRAEPATAGARRRRSTAAGGKTSTSRSDCVDSIRRSRVTWLPATCPDKPRSTTTWRLPTARWVCTVARAAWRSGRWKYGGVFTTTAM